MTEDERQERTALVALLRMSSLKRITWAEIVGEVIEAESALAVLRRLAPTTLLGDDEAESRLRDAEDILAEWERDGIDLVTVLDQRYPTRLREIHEVPPLLFYRGDLRQRDRGVSVVGSRKASDQGLKMARSVATHLVHENLSVIAGLAAGIDSAAHRAALDSGGRTVGVIGTGIRRNYPAENRELQERIAHEGLLLSQFYPDAPPTKSSFPMRNATMSGYGIATVVVEAGETSGARIQARLAVGHGRPVILSDLVVERNEWARTLLDRPGVFVASSASEVMNCVKQVDEQSTALLRAVVHGAG